MFSSPVKLPLPQRSQATPAQASGPSHLHAALDSLTCGVVTFDDRLDIIFVNAALPAILNVAETVLHAAITLPELLALSEALDVGMARAAQEACVSAIQANQGGDGQTVLDGASGRSFTLQTRCLQDGGFMAVFEEATGRRAAEADAVERAMLDPLTGLPNRQLFEKSVLHAMQSGSAGPTERGHALMILDLDRFKAVNDTLGHPVGDGLLRLVSRRLRSVLRQPDVIARLGGDEFALLISSDPEPAHLVELAKRLVDVVGRPYLVDGHLVNVGASIGIAVSPADGLEHAQLLRAADLALYASKKAGRSTYTFFDPAMDKSALARRALEIDLRKALPMREFKLHFQPQIDLERNAVLGFEALLRWDSPERGLVSPGDFIPVAEEIGLIVPLGEWVIQEGCRQAMEWPDHLTVAVNVSPHQFGDTSRLVQVINRALAATGLPGSRLEIEITESVMLRNETVVLDALHSLRAIGVRVAMDDFGTGYSSLSQLSSFPFDKIKIDRSFVGGPGDVAGQNAIIRAITALGVSLGMETIAEGVETAGQLDRIRAEGCTSVQGYLFSRPIPSEGIASLLAEFADGRAVPTQAAANSS